MKERIKNLNVYKLYSLLFVIVFFIVFLPLSFKSLSFGLSGMYDDGLTQHVLFFYDYIDKIKNCLFNGASFAMFDFNLGLGADTISSYAYYGLFDPLNIIGIILPLKWIEFSYYLTLALKLYLGGLFFILFAKKILIKNKWALISTGILYAFNSCFLMLVLKHGIFAGVLMIFPLVLLGAYKVILKEKPYLLIFSTLYAVLSQFYLYAYLALGFEIFVLVKSFISKEHKKEYFISLLKTNMFFALGTLLGSFVIFSQLYAIINNGRASGNTLINYGEGYFATLIFGSLLPTPVMHQGSTIGHFLATILVIIFFTSYKKEKWLKVWLGIQLPMMLLSIFGYTFSLFTYVNNRWSFIVIAPICLISGLMIERIKEIKKEDMNKSLKICSCTFVLGLIFLVNYLVKNFLVIETLYSILIRVISTGLLLLVCYYVYQYDFNKIKIKNYDSYSFSKDFIKVNIILIFLFNIGMCFTLTDGYIFNKYYDNEFKNTLIDDNSFYRVSKYGYVGNIDSYSNDSVYGKYSSTFFYNTVNNGNILDFINYFNVSNENANVGYNGMGKRYILETISGVKYYISKDSENRSAPYNFSYHSNYESIKYDNKDFNILYDELLKEDGKYVHENNTIYINNNYLPLGFIYNDYIYKEDLMDLSPLEKQTYLSKSVILEKELSNINKVSTSLHKTIVDELFYETTSIKGIEIKDNKIIVNSKDNYIEITVTNKNNSELYIELIGLKNENDYSHTIVEYSSEKENWKETIFYKGENLYVDNMNQLLYMGYDEHETAKTIKISFNNIGNYTYDSLNLYSVSMKSMINDINKLKENTLENIQISNNKISGNITLDNKGLLFLSVPYNEGFKAYVNGEETPILKANIAYMALELNEGNNHIFLTYETPYFNIGTKTGLCCLSILLIYGTIDLSAYLIKRKRETE